SETRCSAATYASAHPISRLSLPTPLVATLFPYTTLFRSAATIECPGAPSFTAPTASDACNGATVNVLGADVTGGTACARTVTRKCGATDACGNHSETPSQTLTIVEQTPPTIGSAGPAATV